MADQTINIPRDTTMGTLAKDTTLASILAQLTAQQAKLQAITQALIDRDIIGNNSITGIGDGTLTGAVVSLNNGKQKTLIAGDNIAINQSTGRIDVTGMDVSYNDLDDVPEDIAFYGEETAGAVEEIDPPLYASDVVNDLVTGGVAVPLSAEQGKALNQNLAELSGMGYKLKKGESITLSAQSIAVGNGAGNKAESILTNVELADDVTSVSGVFTASNLYNYAGNAVNVTSSTALKYGKNVAISQTANIGSHVMGAASFAVTLTAS